MLKAITNFKIHQKLLKYWLTLSHFAMDDPVLILDLAESHEREAKNM